MNVLDKIMALKRLSENKSATEHEAASAAARMQELMLKHAISEAELGGSGEAVEWSTNPIHVSKRRSFWRSLLATGIADTNGCKVLRGMTADGRVRMTLVGRKTDIALVRHFYQFLEDQIDALAKDYLKERKRGYISGRAAAEAYRVGCVQMVIERLKQQAEQTRSEAQGAGMTSALVKVDERVEEVASWLRNNDIRTSQPQERQFDATAYNRGAQAGNQIPLNRPIDVQSAS